MLSSRITKFAKKIDESDVYQTLVTRILDEKARIIYLDGIAKGEDGAALISKTRELALAKFMEELSLNDDNLSHATRFFWAIFKSVNSAYNASLIASNLNKVNVAP